MIEFDSTFWALIALIIFFAIIIFLKVPGMIGGMLDGRIAKIEADIEEARRLREEATALLAEYESKRKAAEAEADEIVANAREEAERMTADAEAALAELVARRTRSVEDKIAQAEAQALAEVRSRSADVAVEAARLILAEQASEQNAALVERAISDVGAKLN